MNRLLKIFVISGFFAISVFAPMENPTFSIEMVAQNRPKNIAPTNPLQQNPELFQKYISKLNELKNRFATKPQLAITDNPCWQFTQQMVTMALTLIAYENFSKGNESGLAEMEKLHNIYFRMSSFEEICQGINNQFSLDRKRYLHNKRRFDAQETLYLMHSLLLNMNAKFNQNRQALIEFLKNSTCESTHFNALAILHSQPESLASTPDNQINIILKNLFPHLDHSPTGLIIAEKLGIHEKQILHEETHGLSRSLFALEKLDDTPSNFGHKAFVIGFLQYHLNQSNLIEDRILKEEAQPSKLKQFGFYVASSFVASVLFLTMIVIAGLIFITIVFGTDAISNLSNQISSTYDQISKIYHEISGSNSLKQLIIEAINGSEITTDINAIMAYFRI